jgi:peptide deformylase
MTLVNPVIKEFSSREEPYEEGCLSLPGIAKEIVRPEEILVSGIDRDGNEIEIEAGGLLARVIQHEIDHLNGVVFIDRLEDYEKNELRPDLKKIKKLNKN